jgi:uncharacterized protein YcbX
MTQMSVSELFVYPIKSCGGSSVQNCLISGDGARHDRIWRVVFGEGDTLRQTHCPRMALIRTEIQDDSVSVSFLGEDRVMLPLQGAPGAASTRLSETCDGIDEGNQIATWISTKLGIKCRLMRVVPERPFAEVTAENRLSERLFLGQPLLVISQESLDDLNKRLPEPVRMNRFRPNLVVRGCKPYAENAWQRIRVGSMELESVEACGRCALILIDQEKGERTGKEPLAKLAKYRRQGKVVIFGHYFRPAGQGTLRLGDNLSVLD